MNRNEQHIGSCHEKPLLSKRGVMHSPVRIGTGKLQVFADVNTQVLKKPIQHGETHP